MAAVKISPTLIIGLGSSGLEMINSVRELFYEELGYAGLPLVRFLHISSHTGGETIKSLPNEQFANEWEKIKIADASIGRDRYLQVKLKIDPDNHLYRPELAEWLNPRVADIPDAAFDAGAGNFRPAGRLCLWTNWEEITTAINSIIGQMQHHEAREKTEQILRDYARRKNLLVEQDELLATDDNRRAFLAGTTVGGTGSGILIDLGYYFRKNHHHFKTYGIFTTMDTAISGKPESERRAANAYAAAVELDYFSQLGTKFNYQFPNTRERLSLDTSPYNNVYLLSTKNKDGTIAAIVDKAGKPDLGSLHKMIGISIFFDVFGGAGSEKEAIKADYHAKTGTFPLVRTRPQYLRFLSTFGATALWFPKSRISGAAAARIITTTASRWLGAETPNRARVDLLHNSIIDAVEDQMRIRLSQFLDDDSSQTTVVTHWSRDLERIRERLDSQAEDIQSIMHYLQAVSDSDPDPLGHRFKRNGLYYQKMQYNLPYMKTEVMKVLEQQIDRQIQNIFSQFDDSDQNITFNDLNY
ncbi:MAG: tubulin-like doman-containing protein, partial [bacterium]